MHYVKVMLHLEQCDEHWNNLLDRKPSQCVFVTHHQQLHDYTAIIFTNQSTMANDKNTKGKRYTSSRNFTTPLREITYHMGSHSVTWHPAEVTFPPLPQPKLVPDLATPKGCKAELT